MSTPHWGRWLTNYITQERGMSLGDLASKMHVNRSTIYRNLNDAAEPWLLKNQAILPAMAYVLGVTEESLCLGYLREQVTVDPRDFIDLIGGRRGYIASCSMMLNDEDVEHLAKIAGALADQAQTKRKALQKSGKLKGFLRLAAHEGREPTVTGLDDPPTEPQPQKLPGVKGKLPGKKSEGRGSGK